ncbi:MAG: HDOD domain-containing protein [Planctomycetota bacterium]|nr:HDOD domain-containing protein [Planctomycetota bacterium]
MTGATRELEIIERIAAAKNLPPCPVVLSALMKVLEDPDATVSDLAQVVSADQALTVNVLRIVNSAFYGLPRAVRSVEEAAFRLGFRELWSLTVGMRASEMYRSQKSLPPETAAGLWEHALKVGLIAKSLSKRTRLGQREELFTAGMVHDIGKLAFFCHDPARAAPTYAKDGPEGCRLTEFERAQWGADHAELGGALLRRWKLPESLARAVAQHHNPEIDDPALALLPVADAIAHAARDVGTQAGEGMLRLDFSADLVTGRMLQMLPLRDADYIAIATEALADVRTFMHSLT